MRFSASGNLLVETVAPQVRTMRFERPDLRELLWYDADIAQCPLYLEILDAVLTDLPEGWTLIVDLRTVQQICTAFYRCLMKVREFLQSRCARLILCNPTRRHREVFGLFQADRIFTIVQTEKEAISAAAAGLGKIQSLIASTTT